MTQPPVKRMRGSSLSEDECEEMHLSKYVFKDEQQINRYLTVLNESQGPVHSAMAMMRTTLAARTYQVTHLQRKHINLVNPGPSKVYLLPMKKHVGEWVQMPDCLQKLFLEASSPDGVRVWIERACGKRPKEKKMICFKIFGGSEGLGSKQHRDGYVFRPEFSGKYDES